jgi:hypothetical protein
MANQISATKPIATSAKRGAEGEIHTPREYRFPVHRLAAWQATRSAVTRGDVYGDVVGISRLSVVRPDAASA